jgi:hypothetical protein
MTVVPIFPFTDLGCSRGTNYFLTNTKPFAILHTQTKWELHVTVILSKQMTMHSRYTYIPEPPCYSCLVQDWLMHTQSYNSLHLSSQRNPKPNLCPHRNLCLHTKYPKLNIRLYLYTPYWINTI